MTVACEGPTDAAVLARLLQSLGIGVGPIYIKVGKGKLDQKLHAYNEAAKHSPWLVVRDFDSDAACAPALVRRLLPEPARMMCFRLAVPELEAWLLADRLGVSAFLGVPTESIPNAPDTLPDAKLALIRLAQRSRSPQVREDFSPIDPSFSHAIGPGYTSRIIEFAEKWRPERARAVSPSLASCIRALQGLAGRT